MYKIVYKANREVFIIKFLLIHLGLYLVPIQLTSDITIFVANDYVHLPMNAEVAEQILDQTGMKLPTVKIVDAVYSSATCKLQPKPMTPDLGKNWSRHEEIVKEQKSKCSDRKLVAGHKKDIVESHRSDRAAIYGWHRLDGLPIQPYSTVHDRVYIDYSHGLRPVASCFLYKHKWSCDWNLIQQL